MSEVVAKVFAGNSSHMALLAGNATFVRRATAILSMNDFEPDPWMDRDLMTGNAGVALCDRFKEIRLVVNRLSRPFVVR